MLDEQTVQELNRLFGLGEGTPDRKIRHRWNCALPAQEIGDYYVVPLTSSRHLESEACNMQHCVATYDSKCADGLYQVFSVRDLQNRRIATVGVAFRDGGWRLDQCCGQLNSPVMERSLQWIDQDGKHQKSDEPTDMYFVAQEIVTLLNQER